jgi:hypothetical protein
MRREAERNERFARRYPSWEDAIPDVAEALFALNRYAKYVSCRRSHRREIYMLKSEILRLLYDAGYCLSASKHREKEWDECWECEGTGQDEFGEPCSKCQGSGVWWRFHGIREYICFRFAISGRQYCWHQPATRVTWSVALTEPDKETDLNREEKPVPLASRKFAESKSLIRWVLAASGKCKP